MTRNRRGRNDPCPCGSGKKYKRCCMATEGAVSLAEHRYRRALDGLPVRLLDYVKETFPGNPLPAAVDQWVYGREELLPDGPFHDDPFFGPAFLDWFFFNWIPDPEGELAADADRLWPIAIDYVERSGERLDPDTAAAIESLAWRTWGLWSVVDVRPGGVIEFENVFSRQRVTALDHSASRFASRGSILYAAFSEFEGTTFMMCGSVAIPPSWRPQLVELREELVGGEGWLSPRECDDLEDEIRSFYLDIVHQLLHPQPPQLVNMEGDPLVLVTQEFRLRREPSEVVDRLADLAKTTPREELLAEAKRDGQGRIVALDIPWEKPAPRSEQPLMEVIVVATFRIDGDRMTVETNSERRARNAKAMVKRRLGDGAEYVGSERTDAMEAMREGRLGPPGGVAAGAQEPEDLSPELQALLAERLRAHYEAWLDESLPVLGGQTPREASRTERGRELLEALLADMEQKAGQRPDLAPDVGALRRELGM